MQRAQGDSDYNQRSSEEKIDLEAKKACVGAIASTRVINQVQILDSEANFEDQRWGSGS